MNLSIGQKMIGALVVLVIAAVGSLAYSLMITEELGSISNMDELIGHESSEMEISFLLAKNYEKDYEIEHDSAFVKLVEKEIASVTESIERILELTENEETSRTARAIKMEIESYLKGFLEHAQHRERLGFNGTGLEGRWQRAVTELEAYILDAGKEHFDDEINLLAVRQSEKNYLLFGDPKYAEAVRVGVAKAKKRIVEDREHTADERAAFVGKWDDYLRSFEDYLETEKLVAAAKHDYLESGKTALKAIDDLKKLEWERTLETQEKIHNLEAQEANVLVTSMVLVGGMALLMFFVLRRLVGSLQGVVGEISNGSDAVKSAATALSGASQSLSQGASEQASTLEETASTMEELSAMSTQNAEHARSTADLVEKARSAATSGSGGVQEMISAMETINESSNEIQSIIKVIDEIAFQTNLLALNAAVEAARAGEHGRGFSVVASEVRSLAQRSAAAAKDTAKLIDSNLSAVQSGVKLASNTGTGFQEIAKHIDQVANLVREIAAATQEQARGINQVNTAVVQLNTTTQMTAANSEETASTAEELSAQSNSLINIVGELQAQVYGGSRAVARNGNGNGHYYGASVGGNGRSLISRFQGIVAPGIGKKHAEAGNGAHEHDEDADADGNAEGAKAKKESGSQLSEQDFREF